MTDTEMIKSWIDAGQSVLLRGPSGIVGKGTMFEFGFMIANSKRIIFTTKPTGLTIKFPYEIGLNFI